MPGLAYPAPMADNLAPGQEFLANLRTFLHFYFYLCAVCGKVSRKRYEVFIN